MAAAPKNIISASFLAPNVSHKNSVREGEGVSRRSRGPGEALPLKFHRILFGYIFGSQADFTLSNLVGLLSANLGKIGFGV